MIGFNDATKSIDEAEKASMNFRTKPSIKNAIEKAAALSGVDASVYAMNAAYKAAMETIDAHENTILQSRDCEAVFSALDNPPDPTRKLREAYRRYGKRVISR